MKKLLYLPIVLLLIASCARGNGLYTETRVIMGTYITITLDRSGMTDDGLAKAAGDAFARITKVDNLMSTYKPMSNLSRINTNSGIAPILADPEVIENIDDASYVSSLSGGAFDITVGPLVNVWEIGSKKAHVPSPETIKKTLPLVGWRGIVVDKKAGTVFLKKRGASIDLGAIAKGYASDRAVAALLEDGIKGGIVACAGDIKVFGKKPDGSAWSVGIQNPRGPEGSVIAKLPLTDMAISTSGDYERYFFNDGKRYCHIIDPHTGYPASGLMSVTVLAKDSWLADSMGTTLFVLGPAKAYALALKHPELEVLMITDSGKILATGRFKGMKIAPVPAGS